MDRTVVGESAGGIEQLSDAGAVVGCGEPAATGQIVGQIRPDLAVEMIHQQPRCRLLPPGGQPGDGLFVGGDRIAGAVAGQEQRKPKRRIDSLPERDMDDLLRGLLGGSIGGPHFLRRQAGHQARETFGHLGRCHGSPQIHPARRHLPLLDQWPAHLPAGSQ